MKTITTIGFDIAKSVFQVHGVDADGNVVLRRQLKYDMCWRTRRVDRDLIRGGHYGPAVM